MSWTDSVTAIGGIVTPVAVLGVGYVLDRRLRAVEASEWKNQELIKARVEIFQKLTPLANDLMCYLTFIGRWAEWSPPDVIDKKRELDHLFFSVEPLFSTVVRKRYDEFMTLGFEIFTDWGTDAKLRTSWGRRKDAWVAHATWSESWGGMFSYKSGQQMTPQAQAEIRKGYADLLAALADDVKITPPRVDYGTYRVSGNAH